MLFKARTTLAITLAVLSSPSAGAETPDAYDYDVPSSFLDGLAIDIEGGVDLNGDGRPDNAIGTILELLASVPGGGLGDLDGDIAAAIADGRLAIGVAWPGVDGVPEGPYDVGADAFLLVDTDGDPATTDEFRVDRRSFGFGAAGPRSRLRGSIDEAGSLVVVDGRFPALLPFAGATLPIEMSQVRMTGDVTVDSEGVAVADGRLYGAIDVAGFVSALNEAFRATSCECLGIGDADLIELSVDTISETLEISCTMTPGSCGPEEEGLCPVARQLCTFLPALALTVDIDTDGDRIHDAWSSAFRFTMSATTLLGPAGPPDCNQNGVPDDQDISGGHSDDADGDGVPDECAGEESSVFHRGDVNDDGAVDISDGLAIFGFLFLGDAGPGCLEAADVNQSAMVDISDGIAVLGFLFLGAPPPAPPGPPPAPCGPDPSPPGSAGDLGCERYASC